MTKSTVVAVIAALSQGALAFAPAAAPAPRSGVLALRAQVLLFERVLQMVWICCFVFSLRWVGNVCLCTCFTCALCVDLHAIKLVRLHGFPLAAASSEKQFIVPSLTSS